MALSDAGIAGDPAAFGGARLMHSERPVVVHFASLHDPQVQASLGSMTRAIALTGLDQIAVVFDAEQSLARPIELAPSVDVRVARTVKRPSITAPTPVCEEFNVAL